MSAEEHGGGNNGMGFFIVLIIALAVAWFFAQLQKQRESEPIPAQNTAAVVDAVPASAPAQNTPRSTPSAEDHGVTYYLDEEGNILDIERF